MRWEVVPFLLPFLILFQGEQYAGRRGGSTEAGFESSVEGELGVEDVSEFLQAFFYLVLV